MMHVVKIRFEIESSFIIFPVCCHFETKHNCWKKKIFVKLIPFIYLDGFFFLNHAILQNREMLTMHTQNDMHEI